MDSSTAATSTRPTLPGQPIPSAQLRPSDIVVMPDGRIRAVTALRRTQPGTIHVRLGGTWYAYQADQTLTVADRGRR
ncbi:hypothetical protein [Nocardiopsis sp. FIRDI 009]|uniref:hypothetical protein n=1 Tax=Nocardiopsis sp. FIRDI 009 TaxID=714197 RepID=UPI000E26DFB2|nr:hypothetical protein [Nocardiopsis sp. FIRDI 009]